MNDKDICPKCGKNHKEEMIKIIAKMLYNETLENPDSAMSIVENNDSQFKEAIESDDSIRFEIYRRFCRSSIKGLKQIISLSIDNDEEEFIVRNAFDALRKIKDIPYLIDAIESDDDEDDDDDDME
ncbi:hypothetical protein [Bifidobacterium biavatii]|uniref:Uncharacterized protein n=1 Tax=Bifidobacterium biavatii DSM 23969 TaxID=1437608 RepID=A0A086ZYX6_9BIFI|nr:hypothetical protein [Bifidobacterium biavatii]KFI51726.1 hypothetical protein BBIA_0640 [Bifidobacterium biavatii DSM 23969]